MIFKSSKFKTMLVSTILLAVILTSIGIVLYNHFEKRLLNDIDGFLRATAVSVADSIDTLWENERNQKSDDAKKEVTLNWTVRQYFFKIIKRWIANYSSEDPKLLYILVQIFDEKGNLISSSRKVPQLSKMAADTFKLIKTGEHHYENSSIETNDPNMSQMRLLTQPIMIDKKLIYVVRVGISLRTKYIAMTNLKLILILFLPLTVILTGIMGWIIASKTLSPINKMMNTIENITARNLKLRLELPDTDDEVKRLAVTFNNMLNRLDEAFSSQRQLIEDLSHELKTPLSVIKGEIEVALKRERPSQEYMEILASNLEESNKIIKIVENLLLLSRFESKAAILTIKPIQINHLIHEIIQDISILAEQKNITISFPQSKSCIVKADEFQMKSLFLNLFDNSIKYTPDNGSITVNIHKENEYCVIDLSDTGNGIAEEELPYLFDRYYRVMKSQNPNGFGLGLSIVKSIVDTHLGKIEVKSKLNKGTTFTISLPTER